MIVPNLPNEIAFDRSEIAEARTQLLRELKNRSVSNVVNRIRLIRRIKQLKLFEENSFLYSEIRVAIAYMHAEHMALTPFGAAEIIRNNRLLGTQRELDDEEQPREGDQLQTVTYNTTPAPSAAPSPRPRASTTEEILRRAEQRAERRIHVERPVREEEPVTGSPIIRRRVRRPSALDYANSLHSRTRVIRTTEFDTTYPESVPPSPDPTGSTASKRSKNLGGPQHHRIRSASTLED